MKYFRIIIEQTGERTVAANSAMEAEDQFCADVTGDELLQMLTIGAERLDQLRDLELRPLAG